MGKIKPDLAGAFMRSVGNVTYTYKNGVNYVRSKSKADYTSNTPAQQLQRGKFGDINVLASMMQGALEVGFPQRKKGQSAANTFCSINKKSYTETAEGQTIIDFELLQVSKGRVFIPNVTATFNTEEQAFVVTNEAMPQEIGCNTDDIIYVVILDTSNRFCRLVDVCQRDQLTTKTINLTKYWNPEAIVIYAFATTANGKRASQTIFLDLA